MSRDKMDSDHEGTIAYLTNTPSADSRQWEASWTVSPASRLL
jgi:hypothetical protein